MVTFKDDIKNKSVLALFHNDLDGVFSRIVYEYYCKKLTANTKILNVSNDFKELNTEWIEGYDLVLFVDIAPDVELYNLIKEKGKTVYIFDHHISGYNKLEKLVDKNYYVFDNGRCGAKIFYDNVKDTKVSPYIEQVIDIVNTYDMWKEGSDLWKNAKKLNSLLWEPIDWVKVKIKNIESTEYLTYFVDTFLTRFLYKASSDFYFTEKDEEIIEDAKIKEGKLYKKAVKKIQFRQDSENNNYAYIKANSKISSIANRILHENNNLDYVVVKSTFEKNEYTLSLRSQGDFNVSEIAVKWGGGGHINAAGMMFKDKEIFDDICAGKMHLI